MAKAPTLPRTPTPAESVPPVRVQKECPELLYGGMLARVYVWEVPVRMAHWVIFFAVVTLSITGYYIHSPFVTPVSGIGGSLMGQIRFVHMFAAVALIIAVMVRIFWFFLGNRYASWRAFLPVNRRVQQGIWKMLKYYLFLSWEPPRAVGHNRLAGILYLLIYFVLVFQILTGLVLYGWINQHTFLFGWAIMILNIQYIREIHFGLMFVFFIFPIQHVYSTILVSIEEKNGLVGSIFSGYKFVPACLLPEDERAKAEEEQRDVREACQERRLREYSGD